MAMPISAPIARRAPAAISTAVASLTAPCSASVSTRDAKQLLLHIVGVRDDAAEDDRARSGNGRQARAQQSAGAALGDRDTQAALGAEIEHDGREVDGALGICITSDTAAQLADRGRQRKIGVIGAEVAGGDAQIDALLARAGTRAGARALPARAGQEARGATTPRCLSFAPCASGPRVDGPARRTVSLGSISSASMPRISRGTPGSIAHQRLLVVLEPQPGRGAVAILEHRRPTRDHDLAAIRERNLAASALLPERTQRLPLRLVRHEVPTEQLGDGWPREVVRRGAEAAGGEHRAGAVERVPHAGNDVGGVVAHGRAPNDGNAKP